MTDEELFIRTHGLRPEATHTLTICQLPSHCNGEASVYIFKDEANNWRTTVIPAPGFEGQGGKQFDGVDLADLQRETTELALKAMRASLQGQAVASAISALHGQKRSDGRPVPYLPEVE